MRTTFETYSGRYFDFGLPAPEDIVLRDIAEALANTCRWGGHPSVWYSAAEHSLLVRQLVLDAGHPEYGLAALLHDAHEAYVGDIPTPMKRRLGDPLVRLIVEIDEAIVEALGLDFYGAAFHAPPVKAADRLAMRIEASRLKPSRGLSPHYGFGDELPAVPDYFNPGRPKPEVVEDFMTVYTREAYNR